MTMFYALILIDHLTNLPIGATSIPDVPNVKDILYAGPKCYDVLEVAILYRSGADELAVTVYATVVSEGPSSLPLSPEFDELASARAQARDEVDRANFLFKDRERIAALLAEAVVEIDKLKEQIEDLQEPQSSDE